jgi:hypothetical protein
MAFPGAQVSRVESKSIRMANKGARKAAVALNVLLEEGDKVLTIFSACAWLKTLSSNATMPMQQRQERQWIDQPKLVSTAAPTTPGDGQPSRCASRELNSCSNPSSDDLRV